MSLYVSHQVMCVSEPLAAQAAFQLGGRQEGDVVTLDVGVGEEFGGEGGGTGGTGERRVCGFHYYRSGWKEVLGGKVFKGLQTLLFTAT